MQDTWLRSVCSRTEGCDACRARWSCGMNLSRILCNGSFVGRANKVRCHRITCSASCVSRADKFGCRHKVCSGPCDVYACTVQILRSLCSDFFVGRGCRGQSLHSLCIAVSGGRGDKFEIPSKFCTTLELCQPPCTSCIAKYPACFCATRSACLYIPVR